MKKLIKIILCLSILLTTFKLNVNATYEEDDYYYNYYYDSKTGEYIEEKVYFKDEIDEYAIALLDDSSGSGTAQRIWSMYAYSGSTGTKIGIYPTSPNYTSKSNLDFVRFQASTSFTTGEYVQYTVRIVLSESTVLSDIASVRICNQTVQRFTLNSSKTTLVVTGYTSNVAYGGNFQVDVIYKNLHNINSGTISSVTDTIKQDDQGATNEKLSLLGNLMENLLGVFQNVFNAIINLPSSIASALTSLFDSVKNAVTSIGNMITNAINNIKTWLEDLLIGIIEGLKSLFIPNDEYFSNYFNELYDFFTEKLGILMLPIDIIINFFNGIMNINEGDGIIHIQEIKYMDVVLVQKQNYNLKNVIVEVMGSVYDIYYLFVDMILLTMVLNMARKKFDEIIGGHSS